MLCYVYQLQDGTTHSNVELVSVRDGRITGIRVYFGGPDAC